MARAETGALVNLWYRNILWPDTYLHEVTLGEVRHGKLPVRVKSPVTDEPINIGWLRVTEVEAIEHEWNDVAPSLQGRFNLSTQPIPRTPQALERLWGENH